MELSEKIKMLRQQNGYTLEYIGSIVGVGKSTVRKWENGDIANMRRDKIALLAQALHTTPSYLMGWDDEPEINSSSYNLTDKAYEVARAYQDADQHTKDIVCLTLRLEPDKSISASSDAAV